MTQQSLTADSDETLSMTEPSTEKLPPSPTPAGKRLRLLLERMPPGSHVDLYTAMPRQHIHNVIHRVKKSKSWGFRTEQMQRADDKGKIILRIHRLAEGEVTT
jgi:hypothetical protein